MKAGQVEKVGCDLLLLLLLFSPLNFFLSLGVAAHRRDIQGLGQSMQVDPSGDIVYVLTRRLMISRTAAMRLSFEGCWDEKRDVIIRIPSPDY